MKKTVRIVLCLLLALCAVTFLAFSGSDVPATDGQDEAGPAGEGTEPGGDVYAKVKEMEQDPIIREMVDKYTPDPQQWWDWYETLPLQHESSVSKEYALTWVKIVSRLSDDERDNMNYNLFQFAAALEKYDIETTVMYTFDEPPAKPDAE